jgi:2-phosphoglycerate kinase
MTSYNRFRKIKVKRRIRKALGVDIQWELNDEELSILEKEFSREGNITIEQIEEEIAKEVKHNEMICPECRTPATKAILCGGAMGVGQTYAQAHMSPFTITYEVVCPRCGLVLSTETITVHK